MSDFTAREVAFLEVLDSHYGLVKKDRYSGRYPTRVVEILHWRTLIEVLYYLRGAGNLSSTQPSNFQASLVDTRCDVIALKKEQLHTGALSSLPSKRRELGYFKLEAIIAECHDPTTPITDLLLLMKDPLIRLSLGVSPQNAHKVSQGYYVFCKDQLLSNKIVAIGGLGTDKRAMGASLTKQEEVMKDFMNIAEGANKAIRLLSTGDVTNTIEVAKASLSKKQEIHLMNYSTGPS